MTKILGELIRQKIREDGRTAKTICEEMDMSRGNLDKIYHKDSINSDLLAKFSLVLKHDFFVHVNPFRRDELEADGPVARFNVAKDDGNWETASGKLKATIASLDRAQQELEYLRTSVQDAKNSHKDKDEIIALMKEKIRFQEQQIKSLEEQLNRAQGAGKR